MSVRCLLVVMGRQSSTCLKSLPKEILRKVTMRFLLFVELCCLVVNMVVPRVSCWLKNNDRIVGC